MSQRSSSRASITWSAGRLRSTVSLLGGLGITAALGYPTAKELREEIKKTKSMTDKPFAVNITLLPTMKQVNYEELFATTIEEGVGIIETSGRSPEPYMKMLKDANIKVMHKIGSAKHARSAERIGVDAVSVVSFEAAGHPLPDDVGASVLIPACVDAVNIPVVVAGGIGDARGFLAALALGAEGVLMGTRFTACKECPVHPKIKEWFMQLQETDTMEILRTINNTERVVRTPFSEKILDMENKGAKLEEILSLISGDKVRNAYQTGDIDNAVVTAGQVVGLIHDIPSAKDIIDGIISEAKLIVERLYNLGTGG